MMKKTTRKEVLQLFEGMKSTLHVIKWNFCHIPNLGSLTTNDCLATL